MGDTLEGVSPGLVNAFLRMQAAAAQAGFSIGITSGFRTNAEQIAARKRNGCPDIFQSPASSCRVPTARPGSSNHEFGNAIDISGSGAAKAWANANGAKFGVHFPVSGEDWHMELIGGGEAGHQHGQGAQQMGAIGFDVDWLDSPGPTPEERQDAQVSGYMDVITGAQQDALMATPTDDVLATPAAEAPELGMPGMAQDFTPQGMQQELRQNVTTIPGAGGAPTGAGGGGGAFTGKVPPPGYVPPGSGVDRWRPVAIAALQYSGVNATPQLVDLMLRRMAQESGGDPTAVNNWDCLPIRALALTRRGWLSCDGVQAGDETVGRDGWTRITDVVRYDSAPLIRFGNRRWMVEATPNHRWLVDNRTYGERMVATDALGSRDTVIVARRLVDTQGLNIATHEAALLGWIAGDGHVERGRVHPSMSVAQSKRRHFAVIEAAFAGSPHARYEYPRRTAVVTWRLDPDYSDDLRRRSGHPKQDAEAIVRAMSADQRQAWLNAMIAAESNAQGQVFQCEGPVLDALVLAFYLEGHRVSRSKLTGKDQWNPCWAVAGCRPVVGPTNRVFAEVGYGEAWCVTTEDGTWSAMLDGQPFLTGNSNAKKGDPSKGLMQNIGSAFPQRAKELSSRGIFDGFANMVASIRYTLGRYGSLEKGWGRKGGY